MKIRICKIRTLILLLFACSFMHAQAQWLAGYKYRIPFTVSSSKVYGSSDLLDFPLRIAYESGRLATFNHGGELLHEQGWDIRFTASDGSTLLDHDMDSQDVVNGSILAWVRIPSLSVSADTRIYMYLGHPGITEDPSTTAAWSGEYLGVWHMEEAGIDATSKGNDGKVTGTAPGPLKLGLSRSFDGLDDYITIPYNSSLELDQEVFIECWLQLRDDTEYVDAILSKQDDYVFWYAKEHLMFSIAGKSLEVSYHFEDNTWYHVCASYDGHYMRLFVNGSVIGLLGNTGPITNNPNNEVIMADYPSQGSAELFGYLDEMRLSTSVKTQDWIQTNYASQNSEDFIERGIVERGNSNPCRALELTVGTACEFTVFGNQSADDSGIPLTDCSGYSGGDVWFSMEVPASGAFQLEMDNSPTDQFPWPSSWITRPGLAVYSGTCSSLVHDTCWISTPPGQASSMPSLQLSGYTPGETLYLRVWGYGGEEGYFKLCASVVEEELSITCNGTLSLDTDPEACSVQATVPVPLTGGTQAIFSLVNDFNGTADASDSYPVGSTIVNWMLTDVHNNTAECKDTLIVQDQSLPEVVSMNDTLVMVPQGVFQVQVDVPLPVFSDNCGVDSVANDFNGFTDASGIYPYGTTQVTYTVLDIHGNEAQFVQVVSVEMEGVPDHGLIIPSAFSPNEDGYNDRFVILGLENYPQNQLRIFNANGQEVYQMDSYDNSWDGEANVRATGKKLPAGNYYYVLYLGAASPAIKGSVYIRLE